MRISSRPFKRSAKEGRFPVRVGFSTDTVGDDAAASSMSIGVDGISFGGLGAGSVVMVTSDWTVSDSVDSDWLLSASKETFAAGNGARGVTSSDDVTTGNAKRR